MQHRHLLSNEIDLLVDGDAGSETASLLAHVDECDECRARLDEARVVASAFERVPHFAPRAGFTDRVLGRVQIVEPWHVAALASVRRVLPESRSLRLLTVVGASAVSVFTAVSAIGIALSADVTFGVQEADVPPAMAIGNLASEVPLLMATIATVPSVPL